MNKGVKKFLAFLALLVLVLVIISAVYLLTRQPVDNNVPTPSPSASIAVSASPSPSASDTPSPSPTDEGSVTTEELPDGTKYNITVPGSFVSYSVVTDSAVFEHTRTEGQDIFMDVSEVGEYLSISFVEGSRATALAPSLLDQFVNYTEFEQSGGNYIPGTEIMGETVTANDGETQCEGWLVNTNQGTLTFVISYNLANKTVETAKLYQILGTLVINN